MSTPISQAEDLSSLQAHYRRYGSSSSLDEDYSSPQNLEGWVVSTNPQSPTPTPHCLDLQTRAYRPSKIDDRDVIRRISALEQYLSGWDYAQQRILDDTLQRILNDALQQLEEIRQEAEEASALDNEIDPVPDSAYDDAHSLLEMLSYYKLPMPDIGWAEDGSLGFEWRPENGIATMGVYGDNHVIYGAFFDNKRQVEGICASSDNALLRGFLMTLLNLPF